MNRGLVHGPMHSEIRDHILCCTHSEAGLIAHVLLGGKQGVLEYKQISREMCAQHIGAFGIQLVLKAFFSS